MAVGFTPPNGARIKYVVPGPGTGFPPETDTFLNVNAGDPFAGSVLNTDVYYARYGTPPRNLANTEGVFPVYAEAIGSLSTAMANAAKDPANPWGLRPIGDGQATNVEVYDFAATQCPQGRKSAIFAKYGNADGSSGVAVTPGQPAITSLTSPAPGKVEVRWQTRAGHTEFRVELKSQSLGVIKHAAGDARELMVNLLSGGTFEVTVTAFIGNTAGKPSLPKTVTVAAASSEPPVVEPPAPVGPPVVEPPVVKPPPQPAPPLTTVTKLSSDSQATVRDMPTWRGKPLGNNRADRLQRLADELRLRELVP